MPHSEKFILWFNQIGMNDVSLVGGKNASLGEMYRKLTKQGVKIPNGFAVTAYAYHYFLKETGIGKEIARIVRKELKVKNLKNLKENGRRIRNLILQTEFPENLKREIEKAYLKLCQKYGENTDVAVRSSATAEDLPSASFAGEHETYLNIRSPKNVLEATRKCMASLFTDRAISYREDQGFEHLKIGLSVGIQKMVRSDKACAGVIFTIDTESGFQNVIYITGSYGLGEMVVKGQVNPDEFYVFMPTLKKGFAPIIRKTLGSKERRLIYNPKKAGLDGRETICILTPLKERQKFILKNDEILTLAKWAQIIEDYYSAKLKRLQAMDLEWAKDGITDELFIVQARPETVHSLKDRTVMEEHRLKKKGGVLLEGAAVGEKIGAGKIRVIKNVKDIHYFQKGEVLVTRMTDPDWEPIMKIAAAIVTDQGGRTSHAAIVSRELGIPCIVGTEKSTEILKTGQKVTIDCSEGTTGYIYSGILPFEIKKIDLRKIPRTKTKIMVNLASPEKAFEYSFLPHRGVGLAREEFIIASEIKIHPLALIHYQKLKDQKLKRQIEKLTYGYRSKTEYYIDKLAQGIGTIGAAFYPEPVIVRFSDFKTNEYASLIGGNLYEPPEENPMLGWRGASRYYCDKFKPAFKLECEAIKKVREIFGLKNLKVMIPFCRTVEEGKEVLKIMRECGLKRGKDGLEVYVMCEIPSNVILAEEFLEIFDGMSIGSNDLTQLTLGIDRDSELVRKVADERNEAVKELLRRVIKIAKQKKKYIGICGQAPSDFPDFAEFLVDCGIESMSLNPDTVIKTTLRIAKKEKRKSKFKTSR